jgi:hypothetical protein
VIERAGGGRLHDQARQGATGSKAVVDALTTQRACKTCEPFIARVVAAGRPAIRVRLADISDNSDPARLVWLDQAT